MKKLKNFQKKYIILLAILLLFSFGIGFLYGVHVTISEAVKIMPLFTNISINEEMINKALFQYKNNIGGCLK
jgi:hypothetical protein